MVEFFTNVFMDSSGLDSSPHYEHGALLALIGCAFSCLSPLVYCYYYLKGFKNEKLIKMERRNC